ncbi:hypothetical protein [Streptomyces mirabilis]|uniref:hypothetical protein n=1 Tax=Streptomyces mirabilis TaxID=68239 RepID=UPI0033EE30FD
MPSTTVPSTARSIVAALTEAGVGAFYYAEEKVILAHPAGLSEATVFARPHVMLTWQGPPDGQGDGMKLEATAWVPDGTPDYALVGTVYTTATRAPLAEEAARCARVVAQWFAANPRSGAAGTSP